MMAAAPEFWSVSSPTSQVRASVLLTWPTTPVAPMTVMPLSTPSSRPTSRVTVWLYASTLLPTTRAATPSMS